MATLYVAVEEKYQGAAVESFWHRTPPKIIKFVSVQEALSAVQQGIAHYAIIPAEEKIPDGLVNPCSYREGFQLVQIQGKPATKNDLRRSRRLKRYAIRRKEYVFF